MAEPSGKGILRKVAICIGAGPEQVPYIDCLRKRRLGVIAADANAGAPGLTLADRYAVASTYDAVATPKRVAALVEEGDVVVGALAPCTGPPYRTVQEVRRAVGLPAAPSGSVDTLLDKLKLRRFLNETGASRIAVWPPGAEIAERDFPVVAKPRFGGMGGRGVRVLRAKSPWADQHLRSIEESHQVCESFIPGREIAVDAVWDGERIVFCGLGWTLFDRDLKTIVGTLVGDPELERYVGALVQVLGEVCRRLHLGPEVVNADVVVDRQGTLHVIEVEFVPADGTRLWPVSCGFDMIEAFVAAHLGEPVRSSEPPHASAALVETFVGPGGEAVKSPWGPAAGIRIEGVTRTPRCVATACGERVSAERVLVSSSRFSTLQTYLTAALPSLHIGWNECLL